ncbi:MAG: hypothetical protein WBN83_14435 [Desulfoprunum sp.]|uniref:hypothetical protein n=1 Tax=Desulfoprunum sp. TaxID=2020866 RepID=UPI003C717A60
MSVLAFIPILGIGMVVHSAVELPFCESPAAPHASHPGQALVIDRFFMYIVQFRQ